MVHVIFGGQVFCQLMNLSVLNKDLLNSKPPLCNPGYAPASKATSMLYNDIIVL